MGRPAPAWISSEGLTERRMMLVAPSCSIRNWASRLAPSLTASIEITAATPKIRPRAVSPERSLCSIRLFNPSLSPRQMRPIAEGSRKKGIGVRPGRWIPALGGPIVDLSPARDRGRERPPATG